MKLLNKLEIDNTLEVRVLPQAPTSNFSALFESNGLVQKRIVGSMVNKNENEYLPSVSNAFPTSVFNFNTSTTYANPNLVVSFVNQVAGTVFAAPVSLNGTPAFRMLQDSDLSQTSLDNKQVQLINGLHTILNTNKIDVTFDVNTYVKDKSNNDRLLFGNTQATDVVIKGAVANGDFKIKDSTDTDLFRINGANKVPYFSQLPAPQTGDNYLAVFDSGNGLWKQSTRISDLVTQTYLTTQLNFKANTVGNNLTNIADWRNSLDIYSKTEVNNGFAYKVHTHLISDIQDLQIELDYKANIVGSNLQNIPNWRSVLNVYSINQVDTLIASINNSWNLQQVTNNGASTTHSISVGGVTTASHGTSADWNAKVSQSQLGNYVNKSGDIMSGNLYTPQLTTNISPLGLGVVGSNSGIKLWQGSGNSQYGISANDAYGGLDIMANQAVYGEIRLWGGTDNSTPTRLVTFGFSASVFEKNVIIPNATAPNHAVAFGQLGNYALSSAIPTNVSQLVNDANYTTLAIIQSWIGTQGYITSETDPTVPTHVKNITTTNLAYWNGKQDTLTAGANISIVGNVISATGGGGSGGNTNFRTDNSSAGGPTATDVPILLVSHEFFGVPEAEVSDSEVGNMVQKVVSGDVIREWASFDSTMVALPSVGSTYDIDIDGERRHIYNIIFQSSGSGASTVRFGKGLYEGDQINITVPRGQQINLNPLGTNIIASFGWEVQTHANLIWSTKEDSWVLIGYD